VREKLVARLEDIPGVASVSLNLEDVEGICVRLDEDANEADVLERVRALLVAYGVRSQDHPILQVGHSRLFPSAALGIEVRVTPIKGGARIEVIGKKIRSFRVVPPTPMALAQGLSDAWCQVIGKIPIEITRLSLGANGILTVAATDGVLEREGTANVAGGWANALALSVGKALGVVGPDSDPEDARLAHTGW
jgi:hypothetical protein